MKEVEGRGRLRGRERGGGGRVKEVERGERGTYMLCGLGCKTEISYYWSPDLIPYASTC